MEHRSDKHGPRQDDNLKHETEAVVRGGHESRVSEWREPEPPGEDQPAVSAIAGGASPAGVPTGMSPHDVALRSNLARYLGKDVYPADRDQLLSRMREQNAPDGLLDRVRSLPPGRDYESVGQICRDLGVGMERTRY